MCEKCISALQQFFDSSPDAGYNSSSCFNHPLPLDCESRLSESWAAFQDLTEDQWIRVRSTVDLKMAVRLNTYGLRMAALAVRTQDQRNISNGLIALTIDDRKLDVRDVYRTACALYDAAKRIEADVDYLFNAAASLAVPRRKDDLINNFLLGPDFMKSLESMYYEAVDDPDGFWYRDIPW